MPTIASLASTSAADKEQSVEDALRLRGIQVDRFNVEDIAVSADPVLPAFLYNGQPLAFDGVIFGEVKGGGLDLAYTLDAAGIPAINSWESVTTSIHKGRTNALLKSIALPNIPVPRSFEVRSIKAGVQAARHLGYPVVIKSAVGFGGEQVRMATDDTTAEQVLTELQADEVDTVISEFVDCRGRATRVIVINGTAIRVATQHQAPKGEFRTQRTWGAIASVVTPTEEQCLLAESIAKLSGHGCVGIDIGIVESGRKDSLVVFEINSQPALRKITDESGYDFPGVIAEYFLAKIEHWNNGGRGNPPAWQPPQPKQLVA